MKLYFIYPINSQNAITNINRNVIYTARIINKIFHTTFKLLHQDVKELGLTDATVLDSYNCSVGLSVIGKEA